MSITIIGNLLPFSAELFYAKYLLKLGFNVKLIDQYNNISHKFLVRFLSTRFKPYRFTLYRLPINKNIHYIDKSDLVIVFKGELLTDSSLRLLSDMNTWLFYPDTYRFPLILRGRLHYFRGVIVTTPHVEFFYKLGARRVITLFWSCDPELHRPLGIEKVRDVSFVGTFYYNRWKVLRALKACLRRDIDIFGNFWILRVGRHMPPVYGEDYVKVINETKVNLNIHHPVDVVAEAPNMRTFEVAGCGGFLLTEYMGILKSLFSKIETYRNMDELCEKLKYYISDEKAREEIGLSLRDECVRRHSYLHRAEQIAKLI